MVENHINWNEKNDVFELFELVYVFICELAYVKE